jgi:phosphoribosyl 1,2-cyclic phosphodiesterase
MRFCILASGSGGNAVWAEEGGSAVVVDNGLSLSEFRRRAKLRGLDPGRIKGILLTHEHVDHLLGVGRLARACRAAVYASPGTLAAAVSKGGLDAADARELCGGGSEAIGPFSACAVPSSHDAAQPQLYVLRAGGASLGVATDLGEVTGVILRNFLGLTATVVEFNHDPGMLEAGRYPAFLKARVRGRKGHLSNAQGAEFLAKVNHPGLKCVVLGHLSKNNNRPDLALAAARAALEGGTGSPRLEVASQENPTPVFEI